MSLLPRRLRAGPLTAVLDGGDLRYVRCGALEIVRRLHGAVRDATWDTIPGRLTDLVVDAGEDAFAVTYASVHQTGDIDFTWRATIEGHREGAVTFTFDGQAHRDFTKNRIGLCALLPLRTWTGRSVRVTPRDGAAREAVVPALVAIEQPIAGLHDLGELAADLLPDLSVQIAFEGDLFEIEDQRNWIDASFKAYGTPLAWPRPVAIEAGARVWQRITLRVSEHGSPRRSAASTDIDQSPVVIRLRQADVPERPCPPLGIGVGRLDATNAAERMAAALAHLGPSHVRLVVGPSEHAARACLARYDAAARAARAVPIELVLEVPTTPAETQALCSAIAEAWPHGVACTRVLAQADGQPTTTATALDGARHLAALMRWAATPVLSGSRADLYEQHLFPPPAGDGVFWGMNPQVHAFDVTSLAETPAAAPAQVASMAARHPDTHRVVSPITLERRGRPDAALRRSPFAAAWTCAMLARLLATEVTALTFGDDLAHLVNDDGTLTPMAAMLRDVSSSATSSADGQPAAAAPLHVSALVTDDDWLAATVVRRGASRVIWVVNPSPQVTYGVDLHAVWPSAPAHIDVASCGILRIDDNGTHAW